MIPIHHTSYIIHQSFASTPLLRIKELIPGILIITGPELLDQIPTLIRKPIKVLPIDDLLLNDLNQLQLVVIVLIEVFLILEIWGLLNEGKIGEVPDVRPHDLHYDLFGALVAELVVDEDRADKAFEDIA